MKRSILAMMFIATLISSTAFAQSTDETTTAPATTQKPIFRYGFQYHGNFAAAHFPHFDGICAVKDAWVMAGEDVSHVPLSGVPTRGQYLTVIIEVFDSCLGHDTMWAIGYAPPDDLKMNIAGVSTVGVVTLRDAITNRTFQVSVQMTGTSTPAGSKPFSDVRHFRQPGSILNIKFGSDTRYATFKAIITDGVEQYGGEDGSGFITRDQEGIVEIIR